MTINLRSIDLNLLILFEALVEERSVSLAAVRVGLTPSAVSHALRRLRHTLDDELLVRRGSTLEPTPHAVQLLATLGPALEQIASALDMPRRFEPASTHQHFHLSVSDYVGEFLLPRLFSHLHAEAPGVSVTVAYPESGGSSDVAAYEGVEITLSIHGEAHRARPVTSLRLIDDTFLVLMRRGHPASSQPLTLTDYVGLRHLKVSGLGSAIDHRLSGMGLSRRIMAQIPTWQNVLPIVESSDLVVVIPKHWMLRPLIRERFSAQPLPLEDFFVSVDAQWHPRNEHDPGHRWFRNLIKDLFAQFEM